MLESANGVTDFVPGLVNVVFGDVIDMDALDWSRDLAYHNSSCCHNVSKIVGGQALIIVGTLGAGEFFEGGAGLTELGDAVAPSSVSRALTEADLGVKGTISELRGTLSVENGVARARIDMIRGNVENPFEIINNLSNTARANGATTLRIEGTLANERLYNILKARYGLTSEGATDVITIPLKAAK
jgi:hypothetical protein